MSSLPDLWRAWIQFLQFVFIIYMLQNAYLVFFHLSPYPLPQTGSKELRIREGVGGTIPFPSLHSQAFALVGWERRRPGGNIEGGVGNFSNHCSTAQPRNVWLRDPFFLTLMISPLLGWGGKVCSQSSGFPVGPWVPSVSYLHHCL